MKLNLRSNLSDVFDNRIANLFAQREITKVCELIEWYQACKEKPYYENRIEGIGHISLVKIKFFLEHVKKGFYD